MKVLWLMPLTALLFFGAAFVTLRAAEQATNQPARLAVPFSASAAAASAAPPAPPTSSSKHPPPSTPEESATIADDPTIAPDPAQSADNDVSFPTDI
jgi:hypothetical protein